MMRYLAVCPAWSNNLDLVPGLERSLHGEGLKKGPEGLITNFIVGFWMDAVRWDTCGGA